MDKALMLEFIVGVWAPTWLEEARHPGLLGDETRLQTLFPRREEMGDHEFAQIVSNVAHDAQRLEEHAAKLLNQSAFPECSARHGGCAAWEADGTDPWEGILRAVSEACYESIEPLAQGESLFAAQQRLFYPKNAGYAHSVGMKEGLHVGWCVAGLLANEAALVAKVTSADEAYEVAKAALHRGRDRATYKAAEAADRLQ